ncbi:MAG: LysR family transcriptional regulator [Betaproteobacteria bacterium]|nr:LysR family transcriptional regulator [Betaproteobacteria bacterium]
MLHVTLRQLRVFESVARHLSFSRAAEELYLSQPAVSMQIKQLEENVGLPLFEQLGKRIYLTEGGRELFHYSRAISQQLADMEAAIGQLKGLEKGKLAISVVSTANYFAPPLLAKFCEKHKEIAVSLNVGNREAVLKALAENETDLAVMGQPPEGMDIVAQTFMENPLVVIASPAHPLCKEKKISLKRLAEEVFVVREQGSGTRGSAERFFAAHGIDYKPGMEMGTNEAVKQAVQAGMGLGIISQQTIELELETGRLRVLPVEGFPILRHWYIVHRTQKRLSTAAQAFRDYLLRDAVILMKKGAGKR